VTLERLRAGLDHWAAPPVTADVQPAEGPAVAAMPEDPIDATVLADLRELQEEGEPDLVDHLISLFLASTPPRLEAIRDAVARGDALALAREAHTLKGSCSSLGARPMACVCEELEALGRHEDLARVAAAVDQLSAEFDRVGLVLHAA